MGEYDKMSDIIKAPTGMSKSLRTTAFFAVTFSTVAIAVCMISFPLVFNYMQALQASVESDIHYCQSVSREMWKQMVDMQHGSDAPTSRLANSISMLKTVEPEFNPNQFDSHRKKRQAALTTCCTCHRGASGAAGPPGKDGASGFPGDDGPPGDNGQPAPLNYNPQDLIPPQCPCEADPGIGGPPGPKGPAGPPGQAGEPGADGTPAEPGPKGQVGNPGRAGAQGPKGPPGDPGPVLPRDAPAGPPGVPGRPGAAGQPGSPGSDGKPGSGGANGQPGQPGTPGRDGGAGPRGLKGPDGADGLKGGCDTCPTPRLAPGY